MNGSELTAMFINELNKSYAGRKVGNVNGYRDQWFLGAYYTYDDTVVCHFCQGRNVGRINSNGGYAVSFSVDGCKNLSEMFDRFYQLDNKYPDRRCGDC